MDKKIVLFIDENQALHEGMEIQLSELCGDNIEVKAISPESNLSEMVTIIQSEYGERLVSLMLDERLDEQDVCEYTGTKLAEEYRCYDTKIPIYILTSYPGDIETDNGSLEYVISKSDLSRSEIPIYLKQRIRRHINQFLDIRNDRVERIDKLIRKSIISGLDQAEDAELTELNIWRLTPIQLFEHANTAALKTWLDKQEVLLNQIEENIKN